MDSNRKFINFEELLADGHPNSSVIVIPCGNINSAKKILNSQKIVDPLKILLHIGVNDVDDYHLQDLAFQLKNLAEKFHNKYGCQIFVSYVTLRNDHYESHVQAVNQELSYQLRRSHSHVIKIEHKNLQSGHLYDDRHLRRNKIQGETISAVQLLAKNIYEKMCLKVLDTKKLTKILRYTKRYNQQPYKANYNTRHRNNYGLRTTGQRYNPPPQSYNQPPNFYSTYMEQRYEWS